MFPREKEEKFQQLMDFERGRIIGLRQGGFFLLRKTSSCAMEYFHSNASLEAKDLPKIEKLAKETKADVCARQSTPALHGGK